MRKNVHVDASDQSSLRSSLKDNRETKAVRIQAFLIGIFSPFLPTVTPPATTELHLPALFNIRKDPTSSLRYFKSHESSSVTCQTLNHVLGRRPSPPILLILPEPSSFCFLLRMKLKEAYSLPEMLRLGLLYSA